MSGHDRCDKAIALTGNPNSGYFQNFENGSAEQRNSYNGPTFHSQRLTCIAGVLKRRRILANARLLVARTKINNPTEFKKYADQVPAILAKYGSEPLTRGWRFQIMEGPKKFESLVLIEFPSFDQAVACFNSDVYNKASAHRRADKVFVDWKTEPTSRGGYYYDAR